MDLKRLTRFIEFFPIQVTSISRILANFSYFSFLENGFKVRVLRLKSRLEPVMHHDDVIGFNNFFGS